MHAGGMGKLLSLDARGRFGYSGAFARIAFGYTRFGFYSWYSGIYSKKYYYGKPYISRMKFYRPTNPQTTAQQAWRAVFTAGKTSWDSLTAPQKETWRKRGMKKKMTGYNAFQSEYLKANRL